MQVESAVRMMGGPSCSGGLFYISHSLTVRAPLDTSVLAAADHDVDLAFERTVSSRAPPYVPPAPLLRRVQTFGRHRDRCEWLLKMWGALES